MPDGLTTAGFGAGLARGLANVYSTKRANDEDERRQKEARQQQVALSVFNHLLSRDDIKNFEDVQPFYDMARGVEPGKRPRLAKGEVDPNEIMAQVLAPHFSAKGAAAAGVSAPGGPDAQIPASASSSSAGATSDQLASVGAPAAPQVPSTPNQPAQGGRSLLGVPLLSDEEKLARDIHTKQAVANAEDIRKTQKAREFYQEFSKMDPDFELRDALRMAGFNVDINRSSGSSAVMRGFDAQIARKETELGRRLTTDEAEQVRTEWYAANRSMGVNREALARATFGKAFELLDPKQQQQVILQETTLLGQHSYATTAAGNQADFNAPITPAQSATTELPVGTTGPQLEGQQVPTAQDRDSYRTVEGVEQSLNDIKTLIKVLPHDSDLIGGRLPGAVNAARRRMPEYRAQYAALESRVSGIVNTLARAAGQKGSQSEGDAMRAEQSIVALKDAILAGDTYESALARIDESLKMTAQVKTKLPPPARPTAPGKGGAASVAPPDLRAKARQVLAANGKAADDTAVSTFLRNNPNFK